MHAKKESDWTKSRRLSDDGIHARVLAGINKSVWLDIKAFCETSDDYQLSDDPPCNANTDAQFLDTIMWAVAPKTAL